MFRGIRCYLYGLCFCVFIGYSSFLAGFWFCDCNCCYLHGFKILIETVAIYVCFFGVWRLLLRIRIVLSVLHGIRCHLCVFCFLRFLLVIYMVCLQMISTADFNR